MRVRYSVYFHHVTEFDIRICYTEKILFSFIIMSLRGWLRCSIITYFSHHFRASVYASRAASARKYRYQLMSPHHFRFCAILHFHC